MNMEKDGAALEELSLAVWFIVIIMFEPEESMAPDSSGCCCS